jgi:hypothetical protein
VVNADTLPMFVLATAMLVALLASIRGVETRWMHEAFLGREARRVDVAPEREAVGRRGAWTVHLLREPDRGLIRSVFVELSRSPVVIRPRASLEESSFSGDAAFDAVAVVSGPEVELRARLDAATRATLAAFVQVGGAFEGGVVMIPWDRATSFALQHPRVDALIEAVNALSRPPRDLMGRVREIALNDPRGRVRLRCLETFERTFGLGPPTRKLAGEMAVNASGEARLRAAEISGDVDAWAALAADRHEPWESRGAALRWLANRRDFSVDHLDELMVVALRGPDPLTAVAVGLMRGEHGARWKDTLRSLVHSAWLERWDGDARWREQRELTSSLLGAFGAQAEAEDEALLLDLAEVDEDGVAAAALSALARVGGARSLARLAQSSRRGPAARAAAEIRRRLGADSAGSVSLAMGTSGALSTAADAGGAVGRAALVEQEGARRPRG